MKCARLALAVTVCSLSVFSQDTVKPAEGSPPNIKTEGFNLRSSQQLSLSEPWRIIPDNAGGSQATAWLDSGADQSAVAEWSKPEDKDCFAIRSFLMAREDKHSDATYLKAYSTCRPSNRYRLKTAEAKPKSADY